MEKRKNLKRNIIILLCVNILSVVMVIAMFSYTTFSLFSSRETYNGGEISIAAESDL